MIISVFWKIGWFLTQLIKLRVSFDAQRMVASKVACSEKSRGLSSQFLLKKPYGKCVSMVAIVKEKCCFLERVSKICLEMSSMVRSVIPISKA